MGAKVFISHSDEDIQRCAPLLRTLDSWQVSYYFDALDRRSTQSLSQATQQAMVECDILLRVCTRHTTRSYWMSIEAGAFLSLQADDHKANQPERRKMVNLILDSAYTPEPFDISAAVVDATNTRWPGWVNDLRRALDLSPLQDIARIAHDINPPPETGVSRRAALGLGAAGVATLAAGGAGVFWFARNYSASNASSPTPTPPSRDSRLRWSFYAGDPNQQVANLSSISGAVAVEGNSIYVATQLGTVFAVSLTGQQLWRFSAGEGAAIYQGPATENNVVYVCAHNVGIVAIQNGERLWLDKSAGFSYTVPVIADGKLFLNAIDENLSFVTVVDLMTGGILANYSPAIFSLPTSGVAVAGNLIICGGQDGFLYALDITKPNAAQRWKADTGSARQLKENGATKYYVSAIPTVMNGVVYVGSTDGNLYAIDLATGAKRWIFPTNGQISHSSAALSGGVVYVGSEDHNLYAVDAASGKKLWSYATNSTLISSPTVANGTVYLGSGDRAVYALDAQTGALQHTYKTSGHILAQPVVNGGMLYAADGQGYVYAFALA